jgi:hypothetical protein
MSELDELDVEFEAAGWAVPNTTLVAEAEPRNANVTAKMATAIPSVSPTPFSALTECMAGHEQVSYIIIRTGELPRLNVTGGALVRAASR